MKSLFIGIDFDGTMVEHKYPEIGKPLEGAVETVKRLVDAGHRIILYTMRSEERLVQAVEYMEENGIELYAVNDNPTQKHWTKSPKIFCNLYIDDAALGTPLIFYKNGRAHVDWAEVEEMLEERGYFT
jgi:hydroxymethylpyrimidine pyrophosphatase-like HAD family hydrolase